MGVPPHGLDQRGYHRSSGSSSHLSQRDSVGNNGAMGSAGHSQWGNMAEMQVGGSATSNFGPPPRNAHVSSDGAIAGGYASTAYAHGSLRGHPDDALANSFSSSSFAHGSSHGMSSHMHDASNTTSDFDIHDPLRDRSFGDGTEHSGSESSDGGQPVGAHQRRRSHDYDGEQPPVAFGLLSKIQWGPQWLRKRLSGPVEADLGLPNQYVFNQQTGRWELSGEFSNA